MPSVRPGHGVSDREISAAVIGDELQATAICTVANQQLTAALSTFKRQAGPDLRFEQLVQSRVRRRNPDLLLEDLMEPWRGKRVSGPWQRSVIRRGPIRSPRGATRRWYKP
jgi:hypothetical protein